MPDAPEDAQMEADARLNAPAAARNAEPITAVLKARLTGARRVLEIASGTGEHALAFSRALPHLTWQPSDPDPRSRASIAAWMRHAGADGPPPLHLDVTEPDWVAQCPGHWDAVVCINMIHIAPWAAAAGLIAGAGTLLQPGGVLVLYGPFKIDGLHTADSNARFDASLRLRDPDWGVRDLADVVDLAQRNGLTLCDSVAMPANNLTVVFERSADPAARP